MCTCTIIGAMVLSVQWYHRLAAGQHPLYSSCASFGYWVVKSLIILFPLQDVYSPACQLRSGIVNLEMYMYFVEVNTDNSLYMT